MVIFTLSDTTHQIDRFFYKAVNLACVNCTISVAPLLTGENEHYSLAIGHWAYIITILQTTIKVI